MRCNRIESCQKLSQNDTVSWEFLRSVPCAAIASNHARNCPRTIQFLGSFLGVPEAGAGTQGHELSIRPGSHSRDVGSSATILFARRACLSTPFSGAGIAPTRGVHRCLRSYFAV